MGVVIFVLALTILGMSLFSLSSYEGDFFGRSHDRSQAFYSALGGIERAKFVLGTVKTLDAVKVNLPLGDVVYARARRVPPTGSISDTTGVISWGQPLDVRVLAEHNGTRTMLEQQFIPQQPSTIYRRLITAYNGVGVVEYEPGEPNDPAHFRRTQTYVNGEVRQTAPDTSWTYLTRIDPGLHRPVYVEQVPHPDVVSYRTANLPLAAPILPGGFSGSNHQYAMAAGLPAAFYETSGTNGAVDNGNRYSVIVNGGAPPSIDVSGTGTAIWMLEHGIWSNQKVEVTGSPTALLVIVAQPPITVHPDNAAHYFLGGLHSPIVPVILVTDGGVDIEMLGVSGVSTSINYLSIFADHVLLGGPLPGNTSRFTHPSALPGVDAVIDNLYNLGLLPNSNAGLTTQFPPVHRTWREVTESSPN